MIESPGYSIAIHVGVYRCTEAINSLLTHSPLLQATHSLFFLL